MKEQHTGQTEGVTGDSDPNSDRAWANLKNPISHRLGKHGVDKVQHKPLAEEIPLIYKLGKKPLQGAVHAEKEN